MQIASKIFPFKAKIEQISEANLQEERYASFQILNLYVLYLRMILNQKEMAQKIEDYLNLITHRLREKQDIKFRIYVGM